MKFVDAFQTFLDQTVNLDQPRLDRVQKDVDALEAYLAEDEVFGDLFLGLIPAGSWAHRTIIRPVQTNDLFDADVLLDLVEQPSWLAKDYVGNLYTSLRESTIYRPLATRKKRCVRLDFPGDFHIDLVPYMERSGQNYITNRHEPEDEGSFELSNPEAFTEWMDTKHRATSGNFVKAVRLMKYLRDFKDNFSCKSIILTTLLGNEVNELEADLNPGLYSDVPSTFVTLLSRLAKSLPLTMPAVLDPGGTGDNFTDRYRDDWDYENFRKWIIYYASKAQSALDERDRAASIELWRALFGEDFHPDAVVKASASDTYSARIPRQGESFIHEAPFGFPVALDANVRVTVVGKCVGFAQGGLNRRNGFRTYKLSTMGGRVAKNRKLRFDAVVTNIAQPYQVYWKVRNGGTEAAQVVGGLRGEITKDTGQGFRTETTLYKGSHYVECYVVSAGKVVASNRQLVVVT
jgi:hypothetical protein